jgi:hypothetical protein
LELVALESLVREMAIQVIIQFLARLPVLLEALEPQDLLAHKMVVTVVLVVVQVETQLAQLQVELELPIKVLQVATVLLRVELQPVVVVVALPRLEQPQG